MIIIGYPGVGKSTLAKKYDKTDIANSRTYSESFIKRLPRGIIDLESSLFKRTVDDRYWAPSYCRVATQLSDLGYVVFVSAHSDVQEELRKYIGDVVIIHPSIELKQEWLGRLRKRYIESWTEDEKANNLRAYERACDCYEKDIAGLKSNGFSTVEIKVMDYDLENIVYSIEDVLEGMEDLS